MSGGAGLAPNRWTDSDLGQKARKTSGGYAAWHPTTRPRLPSTGRNWAAGALTS
jgi:hypothetical protein